MGAAETCGPPAHVGRRTSGQPKGQPYQQVRARARVRAMARARARVRVRARARVRVRARARVRVRPTHPGVLAAGLPAETRAALPARDSRRGVYGRGGAYERAARLSCSVENARSTSPSIRPSPVSVTLMTPCTGAASRVYGTG